MDVKMRENFTNEEPWRIFRIMAEFVEGFEVLSKIGPAVSIFGSSRIKRSKPYYKLATEFAYHVAKMGYAVITGGGPGIMEAANKGASKAKGVSIGLNIKIPIAQEPNRFVKTLLEFHYFFVRKVMFVKYAKAFIIFPGGFGTMDEFFEAITLIQTQRITPFPVILLGRKYWRGLNKWLKNSVLKNGNVDSSDLAIFKVADTVEEVTQILKNSSAKNMTPEI